MHRIFALALLVIATAETAVDYGVKRSFLVAAEPATRTVRIGQPQAIDVPNEGGGNFVVRLPDGSVLTNVDTPKHGASWQRSLDLGRTWQECGTYKRDTQPLFPTCLSDGTILAYGFHPKRLSEPGVSGYDMWRGKDTCTSLKLMKCRVNVPDAVSGTGDEIDWEHRIEGMLFWSPKIVEMPDGRLLATMYGWLAGDAKRMTDLAYVAEAKRKAVPVPNRYSSVVIESSDRGVTWKYLSTICRDVEPLDGEGRPIGTEGPAEPTMIRTRDGDLVVIMRTGRRTPLHQARSSDGGRTWTAAQPLAAYGVAPNMIVLADHTLACAYGTKGEDLGRSRELHLMLSGDGGRTWPIDELVFQGTDPGSYPGLCESEPGVLLYSFAARPAPDKHQRVMLARVTVR